jgi:signal transduction histidine kinase
VPEHRAILQDLSALFATAGGYTQVALLDVEADHPAREALEMLARTLWRAQGVAYGLASEDAAGRCVCRPTDLRRVAREVAASAEVLLPTEVALRVRMPDAAVTVRADDAQLVRAALNLVRNALTALHGTRGTIDLAVEAPGPAHPGRAALLVRDDGRGMDAEALRNVRRPMVVRATDEGRAGLGLWLAERVARAHGGDLEVQSARGAGTEARLLLPAAG